MHHHASPGILASWLILSVAVWITAAILPGFKVNGFWGAIKVAALFGLLNWLLGWFIFTVIAVASLGIGLLLAFLTRWLVSAILLKLTDALSSSLSIASFGRAFIGALLMSALGTLGELAWIRLVH
jgi:putative membrane protein